MNANTLITSSPAVFVVLLVAGCAVLTKHIHSDWLVIHNSPEEPANAWLTIKFRGAWFYLLDNDLNSRSSFALLDAMFASVVGNVPGAKPLLTLPVK